MSSAAPQIASAPSQIASSLPKSVPFGTSQISTPVITPPRVATPALKRSAVTNGLDAAAPSFVPSFSQPPPPVQSRPPAPVEPTPSSITSAFTPTAAAFVPASGSTPAAASIHGLQTPSTGLPPATASTGQVDSAASVAQPRLPLPSGVPPHPVQVAPIKVLEKPTPASPASPRSLRRVSVTRASPVRPSAAALAAAARRTQLVNDLVRHFTAEVVSASAEGAIHRAAASALKDRWTAIRAQEETAKQVLAAAVASSAVLELGRLASREVICRAWRDVRRQREAWHEWQQAVRRNIERKEREAEARQEWREVVGAIEAQSARVGGVRAVASAAATDREAMSDVGEDDDEGVAGDQDAGIVFDDLSLGADAPDTATPRKVDRADRTFASRISSVAQERDRIWAPGTFLNIIADVASRAIAASRLGTRPYWSTLIVTPSISTPFATWLACKFDLDPSHLSVEVDTPELDLGVEMVPLEAPLDAHVREEWLSFGTSRLC